MKVSTIESGLFKLDGGAMFGVVPKVIWDKKNPADKNNLCTWALRCLLIETEDRKILVDTGIGEKQDEKFRSHFHPHGDSSLLGSIRQEGLEPEDITDVFITHFHFDHVGGAVSRSEEGELVPTFSNATYWSNKTHYDWAYEPNAREKASFLKENFVPLLEAGVLDFIPEEEEGYEWMPGLKVHFVNGHTEAMMTLEIDFGQKSLHYVTDLIPSSHHVALPYIMSYDLRPLDTLEEKTRLLNRAIERGDLLFFEHDHTTECASVNRSERGRIQVDKRMTLKAAMQILNV